MPDTNTHATAATLTGVGALLGGVAALWRRLNGTAGLRATVAGHTQELAEHSERLEKLQEDVAQVRVVLASIPTRDDLAAAVRELTAALERNGDRQTLAMVQTNQRLDAHLDHHPKG